MIKTAEEAYIAGYNSVLKEAGLIGKGITGIKGIVANIADKLSNYKTDREVRQGIQEYIKWKKKTKPTTAQMLGPLTSDMLKGGIKFTDHKGPIR